MTPDSPRSWWRSPAFVVAALLLLAWNLRPTAVAVGPVLGPIQHDLGMDSTAAGVLTSLPTLCFAVFGVLTPTLAGRFGMHRVITAALIAVVVGSVLRPFAPGAVSFLALSTVALAGSAAANVLLPSLVKRHFPARVGLLTALYSTTMSLGLSTTSTLSAPLAVQLGGWPRALLVLSSGAVVALVPWLVMPLWDRGHHAGAHRSSAIRMRDVARTRLGWVLTIFFGFQSGLAYSVFGWLAQIYVAAGVSPVHAGLYVGLATGLGIPLAFILPNYAARHPEPRAALLVIVVFAVAGFLGLLLAPRVAPGLWAVCLAIGTAAFPMILALIGLRARTPQGTAALSGFAQGVGYLIAAVAPFVIGVIHQVTGGFRWPLIFILCWMVPFTLTGLLTCRDARIEDQLPSRPA